MQQPETHRPPVPDSGLLDPINKLIQEVHGFPEHAKETWKVEIHQATENFWSRAETAGLKVTWPLAAALLLIAVIFALAFRRSAKP